jgi:hypothetical protein
LTIRYFGLTITPTLLTITAKIHIKDDPKGRSLPEEEKMTDFVNMTLKENAVELGLRIAKTSGTPFGGLAFNSSDVKVNSSNTVATLEMPLINNPYHNVVAMLRIAPHERFVAINKGRIPFTAFSAPMQAIVHQMYTNRVFGEYDIHLVQLPEKDTETEKTHRWFIEISLVADLKFHARLSIPLQDWMLAYSVNAKRVQKAMLVLKRELNAVNALVSGAQVYETVASAMTLSLSGAWGHNGVVGGEWEMGNNKVRIRVFQLGTTAAINVYINNVHQPQIYQAVKKALAFDETNLSTERWQNDM